MSRRNHARSRHATMSVLFIRLSGRGPEDNYKSARTFKQESSGPSYSLFPLGQGAAVDVIHVPDDKPGQEGQ